MAQHSAYSLYLTVRFIGDTGEAWDGETAQFGIRVGVDTAIPDLGTGLRNLQAFLVNDAATTSTTTHFNKTQGWTGDASGGTNVTDADQDALAEACYALLPPLQTYIPNSYHLESVRLYALNSLVKADVAPCVYVPTVTFAGTGSNALPPENAAVVSTGSATIGRKGRGRFYVGPLGANAIGSSGKLAGGYVTALSGGAQTLLNALRKDGTGVATAYYPMILHRGTTTGSVINKVRVGDIVDTQRRRRAQVKETYTTLNLA